MSENIDIVIIGGGHNGLVCACYLARAGLKVQILEKRSLVGGAAVTEEFHPGFRNSIASYTVSLLHPKIIKELHLHEHGLQILLRPQANTFLLDNNQALFFHNDLEATQKSFANFSQADADALPAYYASLESIADILRSELLKTPPQLRGDIKNLAHWGQLLLQTAKLPKSSRQLLASIFSQSASSFLSQWFEHEAIQAAFAFDSVVGNYAAPSSPGSAYVLLHHVMGEVAGRKGAWGHAVGGMGAITQAMLAEARALGVKVDTSCAVRKLEVKNKRVTQIVLENGDSLHAKRVVANVGPRLLFLNMMDEHALPANFVRRMQHYRCGSGTFRMNIALESLPDFKFKPGNHQEQHHQSGIVLAPSLEYMEKAWLDAQRTGWSEQPIIEMLIPSTVDSSLAPEGKHVASLFCQQFQPQLDWNQYREAAADTIIATLNQYAPNLEESIIARQVLSPLDLEEKFGLINGDIFHGALSLDQLWLNRPLSGFANYRTPIDNLYLCGAGTHPGGGVSGVPGHNAAQEILKDI